MTGIAKPEAENTSSDDNESMATRSEKKYKKAMKRALEHESRDPNFSDSHQKEAVKYYTAAS